ncbi:polymorphic outer membrane protein repeat-containing protein [Acetitomaculum ruminis DSM 5522]|uniref:Polymorphic outer membrane protein repeat-containing protein n=1 Tax=Acetitomaculum ruminis DSM 5522 TaxID=1120918 RepID=A0A1I0XQN4_9FIRM|nr:hypothetical protein [Acetitomaculum ruminis]SFB02766.1 polymorphic outer membrane protein repeat-containing protein [Acetitomaculum ruminis DSM 5522]
MKKLNKDIRMIIIIAILMALQTVFSGFIYINLTKAEKTNNKNGLINIRETKNNNRYLLNNKAIKMSAISLNNRENTLQDKIEKNIDENIGKTISPDEIISPDEDLSPDEILTLDESLNIKKSDEIKETNKDEKFSLKSKFIKAFNRLTNSLFKAASGQNIIEVSSWSDIQEAIKNNDNVHIVLKNNIEMGERIQINSKNVTISSDNGESLYINKNRTNEVFLIEENATLNIEGNLVMDGRRCHLDVAAIFVLNGQLNISGKTVFKNFVVDKKYNETNKNEVEYGSVVKVYYGKASICEKARFENNLNTFIGGAIAVYDAPGSLDISGNVVFIGNKSYDDAGAIFINGKANLNITGNVLFKGNYIEGSKGNASYGNNAGGAINFSTGKINGARFEKNYIENRNNVNAMGGAVYIKAKFPNATLENVVFEKNESDKNGGAVYIADNEDDSPVAKKITFTDCTFESNKSSNNGGAVYIADCKLNKINNKNSKDFVIRGGRFEKNNSNNGGAVYIADNTNYSKSKKNITNTGVIFEKNNSSNGGAVYYGGQLGDNLISNTRIENNIANQNGGGIYLKNGNLKLGDGVKIYENKAQYGGGVFLNCFKLHSKDESIVSNTGKLGAGIYVGENSDFYISAMGNVPANKKDNTNCIYLSSGSYIKIEGELKTTSDNLPMRVQLADNDKKIYRQIATINYENSKAASHYLFYKNNDKVSEPVARFIPAFSTLKEKSKVAVFRPGNYIGQKYKKSIVLSTYYNVKYQCLQKDRKGKNLKTNIKEIHPKEIKKYQDEDLNLNLNKISVLEEVENSKSYVFSGWEINKNVITDKTYTYKGNKDLTLNGVFDINFKVKYRGNGSISGEDFSKNYLLSKSMELFDNNKNKYFKKTGEACNTSDLSYINYSLQYWSFAKENASTFKQGEKIQAKDFLDYYDLFMKNKNKTPDYQNINMYAIWNQYPQISAKERYVNIGFLKKGLLTSKELLKGVEVSDKEDISEDLIQKLKNSLKVKINCKEELESVKKDDIVNKKIYKNAITYEVSDSCGNITKKSVDLVLINSEALKYSIKRYVRFINEKYCDLTVENGGLRDNSIWRLNNDYNVLLKNALSSYSEKKKMRISIYGKNFEKVVRNAGKYKQTLDGCEKFSVGQ